MLSVLRTTNKIVQSSRSALISRSSQSLKSSKTFSTTNRSSVVSFQSIDGLKKTMNKTELIPINGLFEKLRLFGARNFTTATNTTTNSTTANPTEQSSQEELHVEKLRNVAIIGN